jgi:hypothetical protein
MLEYWGRQRTDDSGQMNADKQDHFLEEFEDSLYLRERQRVSGSFS